MAATPPNNSGAGGNGSKPGDRGASVTAQRPPTTARNAPTASAGSFDLGASAARLMIKCPKCGADARDVARFCPRCHMTLRYTCPSCAHEQRHGGTCDKCGVDFVKFLSAMVSSNQAKSDALHERIQSRSNLIVNLLLIPFTGGIHLFKYLFPGHRSNRS